MSTVAPQGIDSQYWADLTRDADRAMSSVYQDLANISSASTPPTPQPAAQAPSYEPPTYNPLAAWGRSIGQSVAEANPQESAEYARVKQQGLAALNTGQISPYEYNLMKGYYGAKNLVAPVTGQGIGSIIPSYIANFGYQLGQAQRGDNTWGKALNDWAAQNVGSTLYGIGAPPPVGMTWLNE
jgi:hypothetical protein